MGFLPTITGKVVSGIAALVVVIAGISWWSMDPATKDAILTNTGRVVSWIGVVLILPWAAFMLISWVESFKKNAAGLILVASFTIAEILLLLWQWNWTLSGGLGWTFFILAFLFAAAYNTLTCDWIAERFEA